MKSPGILVLAAVAMFLSAQPSDQNNIGLCGISVEIGMDQSAVLRQAAHQCAAKLFTLPRGAGSGGELWNLSTKGKTPLKVGSVGFDGNSRVMSVSKPWAENGVDAEEFVRDLYLAAREFAREGLTECTLHSDHDDQPTLSFEKVTLMCGRKDILIMGAHGPKGLHSESITENLR